MSLVDQYAFCPCGSRKKYKFCCSKVEPVIRRIKLFRDRRQNEAMAKAIDEAAAQHPDAFWIQINKAALEGERGNVEGVEQAFGRVLAVQSDHPVALAGLARIQMRFRGPQAVIELLQGALETASDDIRPGLAELAEFIATGLTEQGRHFAAIAHARLADQLDREQKLEAKDDENAPPPPAPRRARDMEAAVQIPPWAKERYELSPSPAELGPAAGASFAEASRLAARGLWRKAAAVLEKTAQEHPHPLADRDLAIGRLWLGDQNAARASLTRYAASLGDSADDAADIEVIRQSLAPVSKADLVELVQLSWPIRDRAAIMEVLSKNPLLRRETEPETETEAKAETSPDEKNERVDSFAMLDKPQPKPEQWNSLRIEDIPNRVAQILVARENLTLQAHEGPALAGLTQRLVELLGGFLPPTNPKTVVVGGTPAHLLANSWTWDLAIPLPTLKLNRLQREQRLKVLREIWPDTPLPELDGKTPRQAAKTGPRLALAAVIARTEHNLASVGEYDASFLREQIGLPAETELDPESVRWALLPVSRLHRVAVERMEDNTLVAFYYKAKAFAQTRAVRRAALAAAARPQLLATRTDALTVYGDLIRISLRRGDGNEAFRFVETGRQADPVRARPDHAVSWDIWDTRLSMLNSSPEKWVPEVASLLNRYGRNNLTLEILIDFFLDVGLARVVVRDPAAQEPKSSVPIIGQPRSEEEEPSHSIDLSVLQAFLDRYGPKIIAPVHPDLASIAVNAGPGAGGDPSTSKLWTPGGDNPSGPAKKMIIPG